MLNSITPYPPSLSVPCADLPECSFLTSALSSADGSTPPVVCMGCAHPAKFAPTIAEALGLDQAKVRQALVQTILTYLVCEEKSGTAASSYCIETLTLLYNLRCSSNVLTGR